MSHEEIWLPIPGKPHYEASTEGRIRRIAYAKEVYKISNKGVRFKAVVIFQKKMIKLSIHQIKSKSGNTDYYGCTIGLVHVAIAKTFIPNPENKPQVNHKDGNGLNNKVDNLEWVTSGENQIHAYKLKLRTANRKIDQNGRYKRNEIKS